MHYTCFAFETTSYCIAQAGLELISLPPSIRIIGFVPPCLGFHFPLQSCDPEWTLRPKDMKGSPLWHKAKGRGNNPREKPPLTSPQPRERILATMRMVERMQMLWRRHLIQRGPGWGRPFIHQDRKNCSQKYRLPRMKARKAPTRCVAFWLVSWGKGGELK